jgi:pimeloyl-ACP methyl ester carboxylesterase
MANLGIHFVDDGGKDLMPVVFMHAFPLHGGMWNAQREAMRGKARFISFDVRGLGKSPLGRGPAMLEHFVDDLVALLDQLHVESAMLVGLSMGGYMALRAAERAPMRVRGLLLSDTQAAADSNEAKLKRAEGIRKVLSEGVAAYTEVFLRGALASRTLETRGDVVSQVKALIQESTPEGIAAGLIALATRTDATSSLAHIRVPTRVLVGEYDAITPPSVARSLTDSISGAHMHLLPGAGHLGNLENPDSFNALLLQHVERVARL